MAEWKGFFYEDSSSKINDFVNDCATKGATISATILRRQSQDLKASLATSATGFAVVYNGVLDIGTISDTKRNAAAKGIGKIISASAGVLVIQNCADESCDCIERVFAEKVTGGKIVAVSVEVSHD